jgi:hypothetical protein
MSQPDGAFDDPSAFAAEAFDLGVFGDDLHVDAEGGAGLLHR